MRPGHSRGSPSEKGAIAPKPAIFATYRSGPAHNAPREAITAPSTSMPSARPAPGCCRCRCSSASGCWLAIGRSGQRRGSISSGNVCRRRRGPGGSRNCPVLGSRRHRKDRAQRPDWTVGIKLGAIRTAAVGCWIWCASGRTRGCREIVAQYRDARRQTGQHRFGKDPGQAGKSQALHLVRALSGFTVAPASESGDKITRFGPFSSQCRVGNLKIRRGRWNETSSASSKASPISPMTRGRRLQRSLGYAQSADEQSGHL